VKVEGKDETVMKNFEVCRIALLVVAMLTPARARAGGEI
jgi:hypothetical protein